MLVKTYVDLIRSYSDYSSRYLSDVFGGVRVDVVDKNTFWTIVLLFVSHGVRFSQIRSNSLVITALDDPLLRTHNGCYGSGGVIC